MLLNPPHRQESLANHWDIFKNIERMPGYPNKIARDQPQKTAIASLAMASLVLYSRDL
jgi:hypothetical protein